MQESNTREPRKQKKSIRALSASLVAKIAAGQVVERPVSVVKELVENALDAGATHITIELEAAGKKKIIVADNGCGMNQSDLLASFLHHTTSKIADDADLFSIDTFGFRGEALSSIAAVAKLRIESKQETELGGRYVEVVAGSCENEGSVGMPTGTRVIVSGLFSLVPARRKVLKSDATELSHILQCVSAFCLAHKHVSFTVLHSKKEILHVNKTQSQHQRVVDVLSVQIADNLLPLEATTEHARLYGFIGKPQIGTTSRQRQFLFVNGRSVTNEKISKQIKELYGTLLEPRSNPAFVLFIELAHDLVDVNVDPQKTRVRFLIADEILQELQKIVPNILAQANLTYTQRGANGFYEEFSMDAGIAQSIREETDGWNLKDVELLEATAVLQVHNLYLVAQTRRGLLIVDQHAAHERILYQEFLEVFQKKRSKIIKLKKPLLAQLPPAEFELALEKHSVFSELGFTFSNSKGGHNTLQITHIPQVFETKNIGKLFEEVLHDIIEIDQPKKLDVGTHRTISYLACRTAIKAGEKLTPKERVRLIEKLLETDSHYTCPHGRPVEVELDLKYLDQLFKRVK